jgi:hypothetical protein
MTVPDSRELAHSLCSYLSETIAVEPRDEGVVAVLPMTDIFGDSIEVLIESEDDSLVLRDGGFVHHEVAGMLGAIRADADIWDRVATIASRLGIEFVNGELSATISNRNELGTAILSLSSTIAEALYLGRSHVQPIAVQFWEEVELFLRDNTISHVQGQTIAGVSGAKHRVDFVLQNGRMHVAQAVGSEQSMRRSLNIFYDITDADHRIVPLAFIDDERESYSNATFQQLSYKARVFPWKRRHEFLDYWSARHRGADR